LISLIRSEIRKALSRRVSSSFAVVTSVDWARQLARVRIATTGQETAWLRIAASAAGLLRPIRRGDEVKVTFLDGNPAGAGVIDCVLYGSARPPECDENSLAAFQGQHKVLFDASGSVVLSVVSVDVTATGEVAVDGSLVKLGGGASHAVKYEELATAEAAGNAAQNAAIAAWILLLQAQITPVHPTIVVPPLALPAPVLTAAQAIKVKVT
jgi:phage baseplate assembly protein gpV